MKTPKEWWKEVKRDQGTLNLWLQKQYWREVTAVPRISTFSERSDMPPEYQVCLEVIVQQEGKHGKWIRDLLLARGVSVPEEHPGGPEAGGRYWRDQPSFQEVSILVGMRMARDAEEIGIERFRVISEDPEITEDIRVVFTKILKEEMFHEWAFRHLAAEEELRLGL